MLMDVPMLLSCRPAQLHPPLTRPRPCLLRPPFLLFFVILLDLADLFLPAKRQSETLSRLIAWQWRLKCMP